MKSTSKWAMGLAVSAAIFLYLPSAWGQLRTQSGALKTGIEHPKALEQRVYHLTNEARRKNGLAPVNQDKALTTLAREKGDDLIKKHYFSQSDPTGNMKLERFDQHEPAWTGKRGKPGENIHMGLKNDYSEVETAARLIVNGFMSSPAHRSNILNPAFTHLGVGASIKGKESYVIQEFTGNEPTGAPD